MLFFFAGYALKNVLLFNFYHSLCISSSSTVLKIALPSKGSGSNYFKHSKQYKFCEISDRIYSVKQTNSYGWFKITKKN